MSKAAIEYLDPEIANEGQSVNNFNPGAWANTPNIGPDEEQPDIEPPHIYDYKDFKSNKKYRQYFRPYRYQPFPAFVYHLKLGSKIVKSKEEAIELGPEWTKFVPAQFHPVHGRRVVKSIEELADLGYGWAPGIFDLDRGWQSGRDMGGKSLPVKSETSKLTEAIARGLADSKQGADPAQIAAIVAAVMTAMQKPAEPAALAAASPEAEEERETLLALAAEKGIKVDGRWSDDRLKKEVGLE